MLCEVWQENLQTTIAIEVTGIADSYTQELLFSENAASKSESDIANGVVEIGKALSAVDKNGDGILSVDEIFN